MKIKLTTLFLIITSIYSFNNDVYARKNKYQSNKSYCCKVCKKGKACGDSCIARYKICHLARGCACDNNY